MAHQSPQSTVTEPGLISRWFSSSPLSGPLWTFIKLHELDPGKLCKWALWISRTTPETKSYYHWHFTEGETEWVNGTVDTSPALSPEPTLLMAQNHHFSGCATDKQVGTHMGTDMKKQPPPWGHTPVTLEDGTVKKAFLLILHILLFLENFTKSQ